MGFIKCVYKKDDLDGFIAANIVRNVFKARPNDFDTPIPLNSTEPFPNMEKFPVFLIGTSFHAASMMAGLKDAQSVVVFTNVPEERSNFVLDFSKLPKGIHYLSKEYQSATKIAWAYCAKGKKMPPIYEAVSDYVTKAGRITGSREIYKAILAKGVVQTNDFDKFEKDFEDYLAGQEKLEPLIEEGGQLINTQRATMRVILEQILEQNATHCILGGRKIPLANVPTDFADIAGEILSEGKPFSITYEDRLSENIRIFNLRSTPEGEDVYAIAKEMNGYGSKHSASFSSPLDKPINSIFQTVS